jgi:arylsulfatase A-like enzyme
VNAVLIAVRVPRPDRVLDRVVHHAVDASHFLVLALASSLALRLFEPVVRRRRWAGWLALAVLGGVVGYLVVPDDLDTFFSRHRIRPLLGIVLSTAGATAALPLVHGLGRLAGRPWVRWAAVVIAAGVAITNGLVLEFDYPGGHLFAAWGAVILAASALASAPRPARPRWPAWLKKPAVHAVALGLAFASWFAPTSDVVWRDVQIVPSAVVPPFWSEVLTSLPFTDGGSGVGGAWWTPRTDAPAVPASHALKLPKDAVVVLVTIDALRADMLSDETEASLPELHALARESVVFSDARSPSPSTSTTFSTLFTGRYYSQLYWTAASSTDAENGVYSIGEDTSPRFFALLGERDVDTVIVAPLHGFVNPGSPAFGFAEALKTKKDYGPASEAMTLLIEHLQKSSGPRFYFTHLIDAHAPYDRGGLKGTPKERYLRELAMVDAQIGRLRRELGRLHLNDRAVLIVSADHGEAFGEHGTLYHAATVYDELLRVPLMIRAPGATPQVVDTPVSLIDVGPTVLDLFGVDTPGSYMGESLAPALVGRPLSLTRPIAAESGRRKQAMVFPDGVKAVLDRRRRTVEVFDLTKDPGELHNLADDPRFRAAGYASKLRSFFDAHAFKKKGYRIPVRRF